MRLAGWSRDSYEDRTCDEWVAVVMGVGGGSVGVGGDRGIER